MVMASTLVDGLQPAMEVHGIPDIPVAYSAKCRNKLGQESLGEDVLSP